MTKDYSQADVDALKDRIEDKYAAYGDGKEYYTAEDGSTRELTNFWLVTSISRLRPPRSMRMPRFSIADAATPKWTVEI